MTLFLREVVNLIQICGGCSSTISIEVTWWPFCFLFPFTGSNGEKIRSELGNREHVNLKMMVPPFLWKHTHIYIYHYISHRGDICWYLLVIPKKVSNDIPSCLVLYHRFCWFQLFPTSHGHRWKRRRSMKWKSMRKLLRLHWQLRSSTLWGDWWWFYHLLNVYTTMERSTIFNG